MARVVTKTVSRTRIEKSLPDSIQNADPVPMKKATVLGIGIARALVLDGIEIRRPPTDRAVIELLRQTEFDLMLVSAGADEERVWNLMRLIRRHWPSLRWVLFSEDCTDALEILARSLGAICVTADPKTIQELATS